MSRRLPTSHAFHSAMMEPAATGLRQLLESVELRSPTLRCLSNVTGRWITDSEATDPEYWVRHLCQTARFAECLDTLLEEEDWAMLEVGPGQSLKTLIIQRAVVKQSGSPPVVVPTLRTVYAQGDDQGILTGALAKLWVAGTAPDWNADHAGERRRRIPLPTYAFERQRYWIDVEVEEASLAQRMLTQSDKSKLEDAFYVPSWSAGEALSVELPRLDPKASERAAGTCWLIFADTDGIGDAARCSSRTAWHRRGIGGGEVMPFPQERWAFFSGALTEGRLCHFAEGAQAAEPYPEPDRAPVGGGVLGGAAWDRLQQRLEASFYSLFYLAQAIGDRLSEVPLELCIVSSDLEPVLGVEALHPVKATLRGPCKVIRQEYANVACRSIDLYCGSEQVTAENWRGSWPRSCCRDVRISS